MTGIPSFAIDSGSQTAQPILDNWRAAVGLLFDVEPIGDTFEASIASFALGNVLIGQSAASAQIFRRDESVIQRSRIDHIMIQLYEEGGFTGHAEGSPIAVAQGDICCFDLAFGFLTEAPDFCNLTMIIPKSVLHPLAKSDVFHGLVLKAHDPANALLAAHMREVLKLCSTIGETDVEAITQVTTEIVRLCLRMPRRQRLAPDARSGSLVERVKSYIGENLSDHDLDAEAICEVFAVSRPTLYRHFEPFGGVASVIRNWRLSNVFGDLERAIGEPFHKIARRNGFSSGASCARAFKSRYGLSPSEFRRIRVDGWEQTQVRKTHRSAENELGKWLLKLGRT